MPVVSENSTQLVRAGRALNWSDPRFNRFELADRTAGKDREACCRLEKSDLGFKCECILVVHPKGASFLSSSRL